MPEKNTEPTFIVLNPEDYEQECFFNLKLDAVQKAESFVRNAYHGDSLRRSVRYVFQLVTIVKVKDIRPEDIPTQILEVTQSK